MIWKKRLPESKLKLQACFSIYAYEELKKPIGIDELKFILLPRPYDDKAEKSKREFYIPRLNREQSLMYRV